MPFGIINSPSALVHIIFDLDFIFFMYNIIAVIVLFLFAPLYDHSIHFSLSVVPHQLSMNNVTNVYVYIWYPLFYSYLHSYLCHFHYAPVYKTITYDNILLQNWWLVSPISCYKFYNYYLMDIMYIDVTKLLFQRYQRSNCMTACIDIPTTSIALCVFYISRDIILSTYSPSSLLPYFHWILLNTLFKIS